MKYFFSLKVKSRNYFFLEYIFKIFYFGFRSIIILGILTPHGSQIATTVAILSPALPQGESYGTEGFVTVIIKFRLVSS